MSGQAPAIVVEDLRKTFPGREGPVEAVRGLSFEVMPGELVWPAGVQRGRQNHHHESGHPLVALHR